MLKRHSSLPFYLIVCVCVFYTSLWHMYTHRTRFCFSSTLWLLRSTDLCTHYSVQSNSISLTHIAISDRLRVLHILPTHWTEMLMNAAQFICIVAFDDYFYQEIITIITFLFHNRRRIYRHKAQRTTKASHVTKLLFVLWMNAYGRSKRKSRHFN